MNDIHHQSAQDLEKSLASGETCHDPSLRPLEEVGKALLREAAAPTERLEASVAARQRKKILAMSSSSSSSTSSQRWYQRPWVIAGSFSAVIVVAVLAVAIRSIQPNLLKSIMPQTQVLAQLIIPEAHAADAFSVLAEKQDAAGADIATSFVVTSTVDVSAQDLVQHLRIVPAQANDGGVAQPVAVDIQPVEAKKFLVTPKTALDAARVYKVQIDAVVKKADGSAMARDFSWAFQTKNTFKVLSSVPGPNATGVPVNTGIALTMSMSDWEDPSSHFSIMPNVDGKFEVHGRDLTFVPAKPLAFATVYTVTLSKGLKTTNSDRALQNDVTISFETESAAGVSYGTTPSVTPSDVLQRTSPGRTFRFPVYATEGVHEVAVTAYALDAAKATAFLDAYIKIPYFAVESRKATSTYEAYLSQKVFDVTAPLSSENYMTMLVMPKPFESGHYLLKLTPKGGESSWVFVESTNVATYVISDAKKTVAWVMNTSTDRPLSDISVVLPTSQGRTDANGLATVATPSELTSTSTQDAVLLKIGEGDMSSLVVLARMGNRYYDSYKDVQQKADATVSYLFIDRPLYRTTDKLEAFGIAQDRASHKPASNLTLEIYRRDVVDWFGGDTSSQKVYRKINVQADDAGTFRGSIDWSLFSPGWYVASLKQDGIEVSMRSFEVRDFIKPAYLISVSAPDAVFAGETIHGEAQASFFNGTPVPKMKLHLQKSVDGSDAGSGELVTDADGRASFTVETKKTPCVVDATSTSCWPTQAAAFAVTPSGGEETNIQGVKTVTVRRTHASIMVNATRDEKTNAVTIEMTAKTVDLAHPDAWDSTNYGEPLRNAEISGLLVKHQWVGTQTGSVYDPVEKKSIPTFTYAQVNTKVGTFSATTDVSGKAHVTQTVTPENNAWFEVVASVPDGAGNVEVGSTFVYTDWSAGAYPNADQRITFQTIAPKNNAAVKISEPVTVGFIRGTEIMKGNGIPSFLYVTAHLGITSTRVSDSSQTEMQLQDADIPNSHVVGVAYADGGFVEGSTDITYDSSERELKLELSPDQTAYVPGAKATIHVKATQKDGHPAQGARVAIGAVDAAVYAVAGWSDGTESPIGTLYGWVSDGIVYHQSSIQPKGLESAMFGGAERGGGGGAGDAMQVRKNFKDTAAFETVTVDANGEGSVSFTLPDNMTSWKVTGVAVTQGLMAGSVQTSIAVTKPVFVDAVIPSPMMTADKPVIKLRAYGTGLKEGASVTFTVNAPTLGLKNETVTAKANEPAYVSVETLPVGDHVLTIGVTSDNGTDAMEKHLVVLASRFTHQELTTTDLGPGSTLPDPGESRETIIRLLPRTRARYLADVESLLWTGSTRVEAQIAKRIAADLMMTSYNDKDVLADASSLARYQQYDGGISQFAYGSSDVALSAKAAAVAPGYFDQNRLTGYLYSITQNTSATREEAIHAYAGLAALGNPVVLQLQALARQPDLNWHEQLAAMRGLDAAGDREGARALLTQLIQKGDEKDGKISLRVADDRASMAEATAEAAGIAAEIGDPSAEKLFAWVEANWTADAMDALDRADVLHRIVPNVVAQDVTLVYRVNQESKTVTIKNGYGEEIKLTAAEVKDFQVMSVDGPVVAVMSRDVVGMPTASKDVTIERTYEGMDAPMSHLSEGDVVKVTLKANWLAGAQSGCYIVRDALPAGMLAQVTPISMSPMDPMWWPDQVEDGQVTFTVCPSIPSKAPTVIAYKARVMARGSYQAEPALIQSMDSPSVAAVSAAQIVNIQ